MQAEPMLANAMRNKSLIAISMYHSVANQKDSRLAVLSAGIAIEGYLVGPARRSVSGVMHRRLGSRLGFTILENDHGGILCE